MPRSRLSLHSEYLRIPSFGEDSAAGAALSRGFRVTKLQKGRENMNNLRNYREQREMTQEELAKKVGLTREMISYLEQDLRDTTGKKWCDIATALGVSVSELLNA